MRRDQSALDQKADWRRVRELYRQVSEIADDPEKRNYLPIGLLDALSEQTGRVFAHYEPIETEFVDDLFATWVAIDQLRGRRTRKFRRLYLDERFDRFPPYQTSQERRRPKPFEASVETVRRLMQINELRNALLSLPVAGILGGSASYGRFFNTAGALFGKASDADLLLVLRDYGVLGEVMEAIGSAQGVEKPSVRKALQRVERFMKLRMKHDRLIFSHKVALWESNPDPILEPFKMPSAYLLSVHAFSWEDFEFLILRDRSVLEPEPSGEFTRFVTDFRDTEPLRDDNQRSFSGHDVTVPLESKSTKGGFLAKVRVCHIEDERYYPGLHQNLILPQYEIRWEHPDVRLSLALLGFRWKLVERLHEERRQRPFLYQTLAQSHTRSEVFAPHITRRASRE